MVYEGNNASLLVVDDDAAMREMLETALQRKGYAVASVGGAEGALRLIRERPFDVLLSDIYMPGLDGLELAEVARSIRPRLGIILITGFHDEKSVLRAFREGASAYLRKPVELHALYRTVAQVVDSLTDLPENPAMNLCVGTCSEGARKTLTCEALAASGLKFEEEGWVSFEAPSHRSFLDRFANLCELLLARGMDSDTVEEMRVAILELGSNAIEWGNRLDPARPVSLSARLLGDRLVVIVEDRGPGFDLSAVPDPLKDARDLQRQRREQGKRPGGYGIALVRAIADHLVYNDKGNLVAMVKRLGPRPATG